MPDTGAPWNIPYVDPTDLVRDYPQASEDLADAIALGLSAAGTPGIGSNVVQTEVTTSITTSSTTFVVATGLSATITPSSATAKILVVLALSGNQNDSGTGVFRRVTATSGTSPIGGNIETFSTTGRTDFNGASVFLHSPGTTSAVTYQAEHRTVAGTTRINASSGSASSITLIEVAA